MRLVGVGPFESEDEVDGLLKGAEQIVDTAAVDGTFTFDGCESVVGDGVMYPFRSLLLGVDEPVSNVWLEPIRQTEDDISIRAEGLVHSRSALTRL